MSRRRGFGWYPPPEPPPRRSARPSRHEQRVRACEQAMRQLHQINGLGEPTVEAYLYAGGSRTCRGVLRDVWPECARRAAMDVGRETGLFWPAVYMAACKRVNVNPLTGRRRRWLS